jgi:hypothetical protein
MIIDGPDYIGARFEGQLQPHFNNHCMNIKMRELLFEKMYGGKYDYRFNYNVYK